jgi:hypothetical protein
MQDRVAPHRTPRAWSVDLHAGFDTVGTDATGEPIAALAPYSHQDLYLQGAAERSWTRAFRDGSNGYLIRWVGLQEATQEDGPWAPSPLSGRSVELRTFADGELLQIREVDHVAGAPRHGDSLDVLYPLLSPVVPNLAVGQTGRRRSGWPFVVSRSASWRNDLEADWTLVDSTDGVAHVTYTGVLSGTGYDRRHGMEVVVSGTATGEVWMREGDAVPLRHTFEWERQVTATYGNTGATVVQTQSYTGEIALIQEGT